MRLLGEGHAQADIARMLGVSEVSVSRWKRAFQCRGNDAWRRGRLGKPPKVEDHHLTVMQQFISAGARVYGYQDDRWTYPRIASVLEVLTGLKIHPDHLCRVFHRAGMTTARKFSPAGVVAGSGSTKAAAVAAKRAVRDVVVR
ncbi:MAG: transposase [Verrucomicrobiales bacterium]|nr:transposase [Verrucomicrobiales bacterium]